MSLYCTSKSFPFRYSNNIYLFAFLKNIYLYLCTRRIFTGILNLKFSDILYWLYFIFIKMACYGFSNFFFFYFLKTQLNCIIAIFFYIFLLYYLTWTS